MQQTNVYLGLLRSRGKRGLPLERVYRQLYNKNLYLTAYLIVRVKQKEYENYKRQKIQSNRSFPSLSVAILDRVL